MSAEAIRSQNFQGQTLLVLKESAVDHQIVFATVILFGDLYNPGYLAGCHCTRDLRSLNLAT